MRSAFTIILAVAASLALASCATSPPPPVASAPAPAPVSAPPAAGLAADDLVGRWGLAAFHREGDRARTTANARGQCAQPYTIARGPTGGVMMHLADQTQPTEVRTKAGPGGTRYIGPEGPAGDPADREVVAFDGRTMMLRWVDPEVSGRYGTMVYVRCGTATARR